MKRIRVESLTTKPSFTRSRSQQLMRWRAVGLVGPGDCFGEFTSRGAHRSRGRGLLNSKRRQMIGHSRNPLQSPLRQLSPIAHVVRCYWPTPPLLLPHSGFKTPLLCLSLSCYQNPFSPIEFRYLPIAPTFIYIYTHTKKYCLLKGLIDQML